MQFFSYLLFLFVLVFCPLAFGTVEYWSGFVLVTATSVSFLALGIHLIRRQKNIFLVPGILPLILLLAWMLLQLVPLPVHIVRIISPATFATYSPVLAADPVANNWISISLNPHATQMMLFTFASYTIFFLLTVYHLHTGANLKKTLMIISVLGAIIGVEAILQKLTSPEAIYWFRSTPSGTPIGPWVYRNHFAGFMGMLFPLVVALFLAYRPEVHYEKNLKDRFIALFTLPGANRYLLLGAAAILMAVSIIFSLSRGGIITLCIAFIFFILFSTRATKDKRTRWAFILTIAIVLMITWLGWHPIMERFGRIWGQNGLDTSGRLPVVLDSINIFTSYPLFGTGFGTFVDTYPAVRSIGADAIFDHAHNDYIELLTDGGIVGFLLSGWFVLSILSSSIRTLNRRRERYSILVTSGALTGILALLFHSLVDFQMYNGANGLYFFFLCGLAVSGAHTRLQFRTRPTILAEGRTLHLVLFTVFAFVLLSTFTYTTSRQHKAEKLTAPLQSIFINPNIPTDRLNQIHSLYSQAANLDPLNAKYPYKLGQISLLLNKQEEARKYFFRACMLQPTSGLYMQQLGLSMGNDSDALAEEILTLAIEREPHKIESYLTYANWLLLRNRNADALRTLDKAFLKNPQKANTISRYIFIKHFTRSELEVALSPNPATWFALGQVMEGNKQVDEAEFYYLKAIKFADNGPVLTTYFNSLYALYKRKKENEKAIVILREAIEYFPEYAPFRIMLGDYYKEQGIEYRAYEEYLRAFNLDPSNRAARKRLKENNLQQ